jgi:uncharacterized membrane protein
MKYKTILLFLAMAIIASSILSFIPIEQACGQEETGCYQVQASQYEETLGFKNAHIGLVAFSSLFLITFWHQKRPTKKTKRLVKTGLILGTTFAMYFLYIQFFIIKAICQYCMIADIGIIASLIVFYIIKDKKNKSIIIV